MEIKTYTPAVEKTIDIGLRSFMIKTYNYMMLGLCLTSFAAWMTLNTSLFNLFFTPTGMTPFGWIVLFAPLLMVFAFNWVISRGTATQVQITFWFFSALMGISLTPVMLMYTMSSMARVFLITAGTFGAMSLYGYTTKRDLTGLGSFMIMGLWGVIIASIVNIFLKSTTMDYLVSYITVAVFVGLTAFDTQMIRNMYYEADNEDTTTRKAVAGALSLYMDFINLFLNLLRILGDRR